jgi:dihydropteroate synthase
MLFLARNHTFEFPRPALLMGILNVTPDSFSDGGKFLDPEAALQHALKLVAEGADIIDVGGESTRPGADEVSEADELRRVIPVLQRLHTRVTVPVSIDTMKPNVARAALEAGASIVNDVAANREDPEMWQVVATAGAGYICMHMRGTPKTMQQKPQYHDVVDEVAGFFSDRLQLLRESGVNPDQIVLDPGIGFGKTADHNLELLAHLDAFSAFERPLLIGVSRKSFLGKPDGSGPNERLPAALACACLAIAGGAHLVRTHDVAETRQALRLTEAIVHRRQPHAGLSKEL